MRRFVALVSIVVVLLGLFALAPEPGIVAQEATPTSDDQDMPEGLSFEALGYGVAETLPAAPADLALFRFGIEPGATFPFDANDPALALAYIESGEVTFAVDAPITVLRAAGAGTPYPEETEEILADVEFTLRVGDSALIPPNIVGEVRNDGSEPAAILVANIFPLDDETADDADDPAGTPTTAATVAVALSEFTIEMPTELLAGPTTFAIANAGTVEHNFEIEGQGIEEELPENLAPGASGTLTLDLAPGTYEVYCPVGNHADEGMRLEVTVTE